jgi:hypothetical protein
MINFCYLKNQKIDPGEFEDQFLTTIFPHVDYSYDVIITDSDIKPRSGIRIFQFEKLHLETIYSTWFKNIFLLNFDIISNTYLRSLISMKSKESEIIGISHYYNSTTKDAKLLTQDFRNCNYTSDQIKVALMLKYNYHIDIINTFVSDSMWNKLNNLKLQEIDEIEDVVKFIKE